MSKSEVQAEVRQNARFQCEAPEHEPVGEIIDNQYAHIIPESRGGTYEFSNILFLCYEHHRAYEAHSLKSEMYTRAIKRMKMMKDAQKVDNILNGVFDELLDNPSEPLVVRGGSNKVINSFGWVTLFSENEDLEIQTFLNFSRSAERIVINGLLKNENDMPLFTFSNNKMTAHSADFWDITRAHRKLEVCSNNKNVWFKLEQDENGEINFTGQVYAGKRYVVINEGKTKIDGVALAGNVSRECYGAMIYLP